MKRDSHPPRNLSGTLPVLAIATLLALPAAAQPAPGSTGGLPDFVRLAREATPSVVSISSTQIIRSQGYGGDPYEFFFGPRHRGREQRKQGQGSGFVIDAEGHILTNNHVVAGADELEVRFPGEDRSYKAEILGRDEMTDLALIRIVGEPPKVRPLSMGDSDALEVGQWVFAVGNPFGLDSTVTAGIVSAKERTIGAGRYDDFIQTDASINPGNSGGPLLDLHGQVVGVNTMIFSPAGGNVGIGFAIPINLAREIVTQLRGNGEVVRGWLGVVIQRVSPDMVAPLGLKSAEGALIAELDASGPAAAVGLQPGDVIVRWDEQPVKDSDDLPLLVARTAPGAKVSVRLIREGKPRTLKVKVARLGEAPKMTHPAPAPVGSLGLRVAPDRGGVRILQVVPGSAADRAGLLAGDVVLQVNRTPVGSVDAWEKAITPARKGETVMLRIKRRDRALFVTLRP
ncbi:MAG: Do family serine endopeptidase [Deltaproteobacteria bacterium]|nr:Do family serine endopeptidase [Deltaproteobacteria bacterium]